MLPSPGLIQPNPRRCLRLVPLTSMPRHVWYVGPVVQGAGDSRVEVVRGAEGSGGGPRPWAADPLASPALIEGRRGALAGEEGSGRRSGEVRRGAERQISERHL